jgi:multifunctional methyltransferase subunit TRM112
MKVLTLNFLTCAVKACKSTSASFPLHPKECSLVSNDIPINPTLLLNILPRIDWNALITISSEVCFSTMRCTSFYFHSIEPRRKLTATSQLGFPSLPPTAPEPETLQNDEKMLKELHTLLMETEIEEGSLVCGNCGHEYRVKEGIGNFLLPGHLV